MSIPLGATSSVVLAFAHFGGHVGPPARYRNFPDKYLPLLKIKTIQARHISTSPQQSLQLKYTDAPRLFQRP